MNLKEIEARLAEIEAEVETADAATIEQRTAEVKTLKAEKEAIAKREKLKADVAAGRVGVPFAQQPAVFTAEESRAQGKEERYTPASAEYRNAFLKRLLHKDLNVEERAAFAHTTVNTPAALPTTMLNEIWDLVSKQHAIMGDITVYRTGTILEVVKHTAVVQGAAAIVTEGVANDDEQNAFVKVTLSGKDFSKSVDISYAMSSMSLDAFESYLINEISTSIGEALANDIVSTVVAGTNAANQLPAAAAQLAFTDVTKALGALKRVSGVTIYASNAVFYNQIVSMTDNTGRPLFQPNLQAGAMGTLIGAVVKVEESVADNQILFIDPKRVVYNMVQDVTIENDRDIKKHVITYSGYARGEGALMDDMSAVVLTLPTA